MVDRIPLLSVVPSAVIMMERFFHVGFVLCAFCYEAEAQLNTNFLLKKLDNCAKDSPIVSNINFTTEGQNQYLDLDLMSPMPLDENLGMVCQISSIINGNTMVPLFTIREKKFCEAANKYMGEFWYDIERAAQLPPGVCPIRAGRYHVHHMLLNYDKISLQTFPFGTLRLILTAIDKKHGTIVFCIVIDLDNVLKANK